jgi:hypothetical protein
VSVRPLFEPVQLFGEIAPKFFGTSLRLFGERVVLFQAFDVGGSTKRRLGFEHAAFVQNGFDLRL